MSGNTCGNVNDGKPCEWAKKGCPRADWIEVEFIDPACPSMLELNKVRRSLRIMTEDYEIDKRGWDEASKDIDRMCHDIAKWKRAAKRLSDFADDVEGQHRGPSGDMFTEAEWLAWALED
jgi:hypothetical protein